MVQYSICSIHRLAEITGVHFKLSFRHCEPRRDSLCVSGVKQSPLKRSAVRDASSPHVQCFAATRNDVSGILR